MNQAAEQFDRVAAAYVSSAVHASGPDLAWLLDALQPQPGWHVLDLGTGAGHAALAVAPRVAQLTAVDVAPRMLETAARLAHERGITHLATIYADVAALPFASGSFDAAITRYSAHHWPDPGAAMREAARVLRPGAPLVLIDTVAPETVALDTFINAVELLRDPSHVRDAGVAEWQRRLEVAGFYVETRREWSIELATEEWLARSVTEPWRAEACRHLLRDAPEAAVAAFAIGDGGTQFSLCCALVAARRH